jgi:hypothetical protein
MYELKTLFLIAFVIVTTVAAWITAFRMHRRIKRALGSDVSEAELTSINTWIKVTESEQRAEENKNGKVT